MTISKKAEIELIGLSMSESARQDMKTVSAQRHNPFVKNGIIDADAYIEFVMQFNEFINHEPRPFKQMVDKDMRL